MHFSPQFSINSGKVLLTWTRRVDGEWGFRRETLARLAPVLQALLGPLPVVEVVLPRDVLTTWHRRPRVQAATSLSSSNCLPLNAVMQRKHCFISWRFKEYGYDTHQREFVLREKQIPPPFFFNRMLN